MPVTKFRSHEEARQAQWSEGGSEENLRRLAAVLELWSHLKPKRFPSGVFRYTSIEEANLEEERWLAEQVSSKT